MHHINERPLQYWRAIFAEFGFVPVDIVRPAIREMRSVEPWYRFNTILYVQSQRLATLPREIRDFAIDPSQPIADVSPWLFRARKLLTRPLPVFSVNWLASAKAACHKK